jgi:hypothetical protein
VSFLRQNDQPSTWYRQALGFALLLVVFVVLIGWAWFRRDERMARIRPRSVPPGDQEIAWFHTATNLNTWERFIAGVLYAARSDRELQVDDSQAFPEMTASIPEVVISHRRCSGNLRIRWYKQSSQAGMADWVRALARRHPPPLAIVGGGSSDRALELAYSLAGQTDWQGAPPLLLITTATADKMYTSSGEFRELDLMQVYEKRSFRFCFTNRQMARAVVDFVWNHRELRPRRPLWSLGASVAAQSGWQAILPALAASRDPWPAEVFRVQWNDDPYSVDLANQFGYVLITPNAEEESDQRPWLGALTARALLDVGSSIGGYLRPNSYEDEAARRLAVGDAFHIPIPREPFQRSLLVLPASPNPARRLLTTLNSASPEIGRHVVALTGDSINMNNVYRDGPIMWNVRIVPIPLVFFAHQNPVAWDSPPEGDSASAIRLDPPNSTDEVLHFADIVRILTKAVFGSATSTAQRSGVILSRSDELADRFRSIDPPFFDEKGNRQGGTGEYIVYLRPRLADEPARPLAKLEVWTHTAEGWRLIRTPLELHDH